MPLIPNEVPADATPVEADPRKPWKAIVAAVVPVLMAFVVEAINAVLDSGTEIPPWLALVLTAVVAGIGTFMVRNPKTVRRD